MIPSLAAFIGCLFIVFKIIGVDIMYHIVVNNIYIYGSIVNFFSAFI